MSDTNDTDDRQRIVIEFPPAGLEIETLDVGVADDVLAFDISGRINNIPDEKLDALSGAQIEPTELHLTVVSTP